MDRWQLVQRQGLPLEAKIILTEKRIRAWVDYYVIYRTYISFFQRAGQESNC